MALHLESAFDLAPEDRDIINGNDGLGPDSAGVWLHSSASGNRIQGNHLGCNGRHGVGLPGSGNTVGGIDTESYRPERSRQRHHP